MSSTFHDQHPDYPEQGSDRVLWHISRAEQTEGVTEEGMLRTAVVESAAAIAIALLDLARSVEWVGEVVRDKE